MTREKTEYKEAMKRLAEIMTSPEVAPLLLQIDRFTGELRRKVAAANAANEDLQRTVMAQRGQTDELDSLRSKWRNSRRNTRASSLSARDS